MPEPVTNAQIEDVLSSIRRLVSEDKRPESRQKPTIPDTGSDRLVLTPSLRVADDPEPVEGPEPADTAAPTPEQAPWRAPDAKLFDAAGLTEKPVQDPGTAPETAPEPDAADQAARDKAGPVDAEEPAQTDRAPGDQEISTVLGAVQREVEFVSERAERGAADTVAPRSQHTPEPATATTAASRAETLSAKIEALEAAIGQTRDQWEPDGDVGDDYAGTPIETIAWEDRAAPPPVAEPPAAGAAQEHAPTLDAAPDMAEPAPPDVAAAETAQDAPQPNDPAGRSRAGARARLADMAAAAAEAGFEDDDDATDLLASDETVLDEETLREMVAEIVRQELQGALGERITRNVRKLVRREIHRALSAQNLD